MIAHSARAIACEDGVVVGQPAFTRELGARRASVAREHDLKVVAERRAGLDHAPEVGGTGLAAVQRTRIRSQKALVWSRKTSTGAAVGCRARGPRSTARRAPPIAVEQHLLFGGEVVEDRLTGDAGGAGDLIDGDRVEAVCGEQLGRGLGDRGPGLPLLAGPEAELLGAVDADFATGHVRSVVWSGYIF